MITLTGPDDPRILCACLAVDPGPTRSAYVYMAALRSGHIPVIRAWYTPHDRALLWTMLSMLKEGRDLFAVEAVVGEIYRGRSATQVLANTKIEGRIEEAAEVRGFVQASSIHAARGVAKPYVEISQKEWRTELLGPQIFNMRCLMDPVIAEAVSAIYGEEIPPVEGVARASGVHVNDAIGLGLVAISRMLGKPLALPHHLRARILDAAFKSKAVAVRRKWNRDHGVAGGPGTGRKLTQAQKIQAAAKRAVTLAKKAR